MKKFFILILSLALCASLCACGAGEEAIEPESGETETEEIESGEAVSSEAETPVKKELLKLKHSLGNFDSAEGSVMEMHPANIPFDMPDGLEDGKGQNAEIPEETINAIRELNPDFNPDENWHNTVNYYTQDFSLGMLEFTYYIGDIATDKVVFCSIENGAIKSVGFRNITAEVDGNELLERVAAFEATHEQEEYEFKEGEEFLSEDVNYVYYYVPDKLIYSYQLFFYMDTGIGKVINNEYGSEYFIE